LLESAPGEDIHFRCLLRHQGRLALGQDDNAGHEVYSLGKGSEIGYQGKRLVSHTLVGVGEVVNFGVVLRICSENVIEDADVVIAQVLGGLDEAADGAKVVPDFDCGKGDSNTHKIPLARDETIRRVAVSP